MNGKISFLLLALFVFTACSGHPPRVVSTPPPADHPAQSPVPPPRPPAGDLLTDDLPLLPSVEVRDDPQQALEGKRFHITLQGGDIREVLLALVKDSEIGVVIDPDVSGSVPVMDIREARLSEVLGYVLPPLQLEYRWQGRNLHVFRTPMQTRFFKMDYLAMVRKGKRQVAFSTRSNEGGGSVGGGMGGASAGGGTTGGGVGGGSGGGQNQSTNEITVEYENAVWNTFIDSLKTLVFGTLQTATAAAPASGQPAEERVQSFSLSDPSGRRLIVAPGAGLVMVTASEKELQRVGEFVDRYRDAAQRQVWIEAKIIEVNLFKAYQLGVDWGLVVNRGGYYGILDAKRTLSSPAVSFTPGSVGDQSLSSTYGAFQMAVSNNVVDIMVNALSRQGNLKVLASPKISTLNNEKAVIRVVREEAYFNLQTQISQGTGGNISTPTVNVQVVPVGIIMDIIPQITDDGEILLSINPDISELLEVKKFEVQGAMATQPVIDRRSIDTLARLRDGQSLVIAGIIKERRQENIGGVPFLAKLPLLGNLFRRTEQRVERSELVIFITPRLLKGQTYTELTQEEQRRIEAVLRPLHLGDAVSLQEGLQGETVDLKKSEKK